MTENKPIYVDGVDVSGCDLYFHKCRHKCEGIFDCYKKPNCYFKQLARKTQECEELRKYHNKCCEEFENKEKELLEKYNQLSRDFYSGKYCNIEKCKQLDQLKAEIDELKKERDSQLSVIDFYIQKIEVSEQKLERIREICKPYTDLPINEFVKILQIINKE